MQDIVPVRTSPAQSEPVDCPAGQSSLGTRDPSKRRPQALSPWADADSLAPKQIIDQAKAAEALCA